MGHETVKLWSEQYKEYIDIDKGIAPLIAELWKAKILTTMSCESVESPFGTVESYIWITFDSDRDLEKFTGIVFKGLDNECDFYVRASNNFSKSRYRWEYRVFINTDADKRGDIIHDTYIYQQLRFPKRDYLPILDAILKYNITHNSVNGEYEKMMDSML